MGSDVLVSETIEQIEQKEKTEVRQKIAEERGSWAKDIGFVRCIRTYTLCVEYSKVRTVENLREKLETVGYQNSTVDMGLIKILRGQGQPATLYCR
jgi:sialic acid synthase SpsE